MGIDLGSEYFKVAIVKPGVPMEIALNGESKRKTPTVVTIKGEDTLTGNSALNTGIKFPDLSFRYFLDLLGKDFDSPAVENFKKTFPAYKLTKSELGTVMFEHSDFEEPFSVEQILALILKSAKNIASAHAETKVKDTVITVPVYMNQNERKRLIYVAEKMAGLKILELINNNAAIMLNYGMFRRNEFKDKRKTMVIYDMGASKSTASVVEIKIDEKTKEPTATVLGVSWDRYLGGVHMDLRIAKMLKEAFEKANPKLAPVTKPRALAKLLKEAQRVRQVLSANTATSARVENLTGDEVDLKVPVERSVVEELCKDIFERVMAPVEKAIEMSGLDQKTGAKDILIYGGLTRTPMIKKLLEDAGFNLLLNINTDEAAAIGASYRAADLSSAFRVKPFYIKNASPVQIQVEFDRDIVDEETGEMKVKHSKRILFAPGATYPQKKILTFNRYTEDFKFKVNYGDPESYKHLTNDIDHFKTETLMDVDVTGVSKALTDNKDRTAKGIKVHFRLDESGLFGYSTIESLFEKDELIVEKKKEAEKDEKKEESEGVKKEDSKEDSKQEEKPLDLDKDDSPNEESSPEESEIENEDDIAANTKIEADDDVKKMFSEMDLNDFKGVDWSNPGSIDPKVLEKLKGKFGDFKVDPRPPTDPERRAQWEKNQAEKNKKAEEAKKAKEGEKEESKEEEKKEDAKTEEKAEDKSEEKAEEQKPKYRKIKSVVTLKSDSQYINVNLPSEDQLKAQVKVLTMLEEREIEKKEREAALNSLESFIYDKQDKLYEEGGYKETLSEEDREKFSASLSAASDFLWDVENPTAKIFKEKLTELEEMTKTWLYRADEHIKRPKLLQLLEDQFNHTRTFMNVVITQHEKQPEDDKTFTEKEISTLKGKYEEVIDWKNKTIEKQKSMALTEEPEFTEKLVYQKAQMLDRELNYMVKKAKSWKPKPPPKEEKKDDKKDEKEEDKDKKEESTEEKTEEKKEDSKEEKKDHTEL